MTRVTKRAVSMCCIRIGYQHYLMPADKGLKVIDLLQAAFECREEYGERNYLYYPQEGQPQVELKLVRQEQLRAPMPEVQPQRRIAR